MISYDEKDLLAAILRASGEMIAATTPDGAVTLWNEAGERLLGYSAAEVIRLVTERSRQFQWNAESVK